MAQNGGTGELMKSNRSLGVGGIVLMVAFAMGASAQAAPGGSPGTCPVSYALVPSPEPATFVLVGLILAVLPLIRKRRS
jgi:hypothetical protein